MDLNIKIAHKMKNILLFLAKSLSSYSSIVIYKKQKSIINKLKLQKYFTDDQSKFYLNPGVLISRCLCLRCEKMYVKTLIVEISNDRTNINFEPLDPYKPYIEHNRWIDCP